MFGNTGRYGKNVRIENNILRRNTDFFREQLVGARTDFSLTLKGIGLPLFIESHDHDGSTVTFDQACLLQKLCFAFLEGD